MGLTDDEIRKLRVSENSDSLQFEIIVSVLEEKYPGFAERVERLIDLGSGRTDHSLRNAIRGNLFPALKEIVTVDAKFDTELVDKGGELPDGISHTHHQQEITQFLEENNSPADMVSLIGVTNAGVRDLDEYHNLYSSVKPGGILVESWETRNFDPKLMEDAGFKYLDGDGMALNIWRRIDDTE